MTQLKTHVIALVFTVILSSLRPIYTFWVPEEAFANLTKALISLSIISGALLHLFSYLLIIALAGSQRTFVAVSSLACLLAIYELSKRGERFD